MRISDWSSDVCSSDLTPRDPPCPARDGWNPRLAAMQQLSHSAVEPELDTRRPRRRTQRSGGGGDERGHGRRKRRRPHRGGRRCAHSTGAAARKSVAEGQRVIVRVELWVGGNSIKKK